MNASEILTTAKSGAIPSAWAVFHAKKGTSSAKMIWNYVFAAGFGLLALLGVWFLTFWRPSQGIVGLIFSVGVMVVFGWLAYGSYKKGRKDQRDAMGGMVILTEDALVYPDGAKTPMIALSEIKDVFLKIWRVEGVPHAEITVELQNGKKIIVIEGSQYGEPKQIVRVIRERANVTTPESVRHTHLNT